MCAVLSRVESCESLWVVFFLTAKAQRAQRNFNKKLCVLCVSAVKTKKGRTDARPYYFTISLLHYFTLPFPLGRGRGMGSKPNPCSPLTHNPLSIKGCLCDSIKKRGALSAPIILQSYFPIILVKDSAVKKKPTTESRSALSPQALHPCCTPQPDTHPHSTAKYPVFLVLARCPCLRTPHFRHY